MSTSNVRVINDFKKVLLSASMSICCPHCGAMIPPNADHCEFCGSPSPKFKLDKLVERLGDTFGNVLSAEEVAQAVREARELLPEIKRQAELMYREFEENSRDLLEKKIDEVVDEAVGKVSDRLMQLEEEITQLMIGVLNKVRLNSLNGFSVGLNQQVSAKDLNSFAVVSDETWNSVAQGVSPEIVAGFETSLSLRRVGDLLYRAGRYDDAIKWYSRAMLSIMYPPEGAIEGSNPKYALGEFIPFGAVGFSVWDVDGDGENELIYIPSREIGSLKIVSSVINKGGVEWPSKVENFKRAGVFLPLFGKFGDTDRIFVHWRNVNMLDASFVSKNGEVISISKGNETFNSWSLLNVLVGDLDGDGLDEIIAFFHPAGVSILKHDNGVLKEVERFFVPKPCALNVCDLDGDNADEIVIIGVNGNIFLVDYDFKFGVKGLSESLSDVQHVSTTYGKLLDGKGHELYISSSSDGLLQLRYIDGEPQIVKIDNSAPVALTVASVGEDGNYIVALKQVNGGYKLEFFSLEEVLGVSTLSKKFDIPVYLPENIKLERAKSFCSNLSFSSRPISASLDIDGDGVDELFFGLDKVFIGIDLKFV
ncbi:MAG: hypothetical protein ACP6IP_02405 [Candidatus Njordarchaeia archaeon]